VAKDSSATKLLDSLLTLSVSHLNFLLIDNVPISLESKEELSKPGLDAVLLRLHAHRFGYCPTSSAQSIDARTLCIALRGFTKKIRVSHLVKRLVVYCGPTTPDHASRTIHTTIGVPNASSIRHL
jgi:hypothetical protein